MNIFSFSAHFTNEHDKIGGNPEVIRDLDVDTVTDKGWTFN